MKETPRVAAAACVLLAMTTVCTAQCSDTVLTCSYYPDKDLPTPRANASVSEADGLMCIVGGVNTTNCFGDFACFADQVQCLDPRLTTRWITGYDPVPKGYFITGQQYTASIETNQIAVVMAGTYLPEGVPVQEEKLSLMKQILVFDPTAVPGKQWVIYPDVLPYPKARADVVSYGKHIYIIGGVDIDSTGAQSRNGSMYRWDFNNPYAIEEMAPLQSTNTDYAVATNSEAIYILGGVNNGKWSTSMRRYDPATDKWSETPYGCPKIPYIRTAMFGDALYAFGDQWDEQTGDMQLHVWSETSFHWSTVYISQIPGDRRGFSVYGMSPFDGTNAPQIFVFGGYETSSFNTTASVGHLTTGIDLPKVAINPDEIKLGDNVIISFSGMAPMDIYQIRLSPHADCSDTAWIPDHPYPDAPTYTLTFKAEKPLPQGYVCFSKGGCPESSSGTTPCQYGFKNALCTVGCCSGLPPFLGSCWDMVKAGPYMSLMTDPFTINDYNFTPTVTLVTPEDGFKTQTWKPPAYLFIISGAVMLCLVLLVVGLFFYKGMCRRNSTPDNKYELMQQLGSGAYGVVYLVKRRVDGKQLAMKYIACRSSTEQEDAIKEFTTIKKFQGHPNMIKVIETTMNWVDDTDKPDDATPLVGLNGSKKQQQLSHGVPVVAQRYVCLVMPYYSEGDLKNFIINKRYLPMELIFDFTGQLASVLNYMHTSTPSLIHRDLKPENVLIDDNGTKLIVTDFGLARNVGITSYCQTQAGTLTYIAPECWERRYGTEVDIWALGCIVYGMATDRVEIHNTRVMFTDAMRLGQNKFDELMRSDIESRGYPPKLGDLVVSLLKIDYRNRPTAVQVMDMVGHTPPPVSDSTDDQGETFASTTSSLHPLQPCYGANSDSSSPVVETASAEDHECSKVCTGCGCVLPESLPRDFCCKKCTTSDGKSHGHMCCVHRVEPRQRKRQPHNINIESGRKCAGCDYEVTGVFPNFCCVKCSKTSGSHGLRCNRKPYLEPVTMRDRMDASASGREEEEENEEETQP